MPLGPNASISVVAITKLGTTNGNAKATESTRRNGISVRIVNQAAGTATINETIVTLRMTVTVRQMTFIEFLRVKKSRVTSPPSIPRTKR